MPITRVQSVAAGAGFVATRTVSVAATGAGNTLSLVLEHQSATAPTVTDNGGNTWTRTASSITAGASGQYQIDVWTVLAASSVTLVTVATAGSTSVLGTVLNELAGVGSVRATAASTDKTANGINTQPAQLALDLRAGDFGVSAVSYYSSTSNETVGSPWTSTGSGVSTTRFATATQLAATDQASGPAWTLPTVTNGWSQTAVVYAPAATSPGYSGTATATSTGAATQTSRVGLQASAAGTGFGAATQSAAPALTAAAASTGAGTSTSSATPGLVSVAIAEGAGSTSAITTPGFQNTESVTANKTVLTVSFVQLQASVQTVSVGVTTAFGRQVRTLIPRHVWVTAPSAGTSLNFSSRSRTEVRRP